MVRYKGRFKNAHYKHSKFGTLTNLILFSDCRQNVKNLCKNIKDKKLLL